MEEDLEVIGVNYWKGIKKDRLSNELLRDWNTLLLIHNSAEFEEIAFFLSSLPSAKRIIYISLTKGYDSLKTNVERLNSKYKIYGSKMIVIDCISTTIFEKKSTRDCIYEFPPSNLKEIIVLINKYLQKYNPDVVIIDSLSQIIDFTSISTNHDVYSFINYLKNLRATTVCRFILLYDDFLRKELKSIPMFFIDITLKLEVIKDKVLWKG